jgi:hypothetical protein
MGFGETDDDHEDASPDEDDPSEAWTSPRLPAELGVHTPNGPLGSDYLAGNVAPHARQPASPVRAALPSSEGITIGKSKKKKVVEPAGSLISNSMQENFKGFSFTGGESLVVPHSLAHRLAQEQKTADQALADEEFNEPSTEDEVDDDTTHGGRYANARRRGMGLDDDL